MRQTLILLLFLTITSKYLSAQESPFGNDGVYVSIQAGVNLDRMKTSGYQIDYLKFNNPAQVYLSAVFDFELTESFIVRTEVAYKPLHFHAVGSPYKGRLDEYELKVHSFIPQFVLLYRSPSLWKLRMYGGIGAGGMWSNVSKNTTTSHINNTYTVYPNYLELDGDNYVVTYNIGLMYGKRFDLCCKFWQIPWNKFDKVHQILTNRSITLSVGYRL